MVEKIVLDWLTDTLAVPVYMERPFSVPESYVIVEKTGSRTENRIYTATIAIQSYAGTMAAAAELNEAVKAEMEGLLVRGDVASVKLSTDYNFTDVSTKSYRYQAVYNIVAYCD